MRPPVVPRFKGSPREKDRYHVLRVLHEKRTLPHEKNTRFRRSPTRGTPRKGEALIRGGAIVPRRRPSGSISDFLSQLIIQNVLTSKRTVTISNACLVHNPGTSKKV